MEKKDTKKGKAKPVVKKEVKKVAKVIKKPRLKEEIIIQSEKPSGKIFFHVPVTEIEKVENEVEKITIFNNSCGRSTIPEVKMKPPTPFIQEIIPVMAMEFPKNLNEKWGRVEEEGHDERGVESSLACQLGEIIRYLNSIESELIDLNTAPKAELLELSPVSNNSVDELSWETLFMLQKQAGDTIQRNNYPEGKYSPEMLNAQRMFEKVSAKIKEKTNLISWG